MRNCQPRMTVRNCRAEVALVFVLEFFVCAPKPLFSGASVNARLVVALKLAPNVPRACEVRGFGALRCPQRTKIIKCGELSFTNEARIAQARC